MSDLPEVRLKALPTFPARVVALNPVLLDTTNGIFTFSLDVQSLIDAINIGGGVSFDILAPTTTQGDIIYRNATTNARLAAGVAGYHLQTNGAGADPAWAGFLQAGTGAATRTWQDKARDAISVRDFGAQGNFLTITATVSITSGTSALLAVGAGFTSADIGKTILVPGAGAAGAGLVTTIATFTDATHIGLAANAGTTLAAVSKRVSYGTDDTAAFNNAMQYALQTGRIVHASAGFYLIAGTITFGGNATTLQGDGIQATVLVSPKPDNPMVVVPSGLSNIRILDLKLDRAETVIATSAGNGIEWALVGLTDGYIERVWSSHQYVGMRLGPCGLGWLKDCRTDYCQSHGILVINNPAFPVCQWYTDSIYTAQNSGCGFCIATDPAAAAGGMSVGNITKLLTFANTSFGFAALGNASCPIHGLRMSDCFMGQDNNDEIFLDTYGQDHMLQNMYVELGGTFPTGPTLAVPPGGASTGISITNNNGVVMLNHINSTGNSTHGCIAGSLTFTQITGCKFTSNGNLGIFIPDGAKTSVNDCYFFGNAGAPISVSANASSLVAVGNFPVTVNNDGYRSATGTTGAMTNGTAANGASITLPAGNWDVSGGIAYTVSGTTNLIYAEVSVSTTSATRNSAASNMTSILYDTAGEVLSPADTLNLTTPVVRLNLTTSTTVYIVGRAGIVASTLSGAGFIRAKWVN